MFGLSISPSICFRVFPLVVLTAALIWLVLVGSPSRCRTKQPKASFSVIVLPFRLGYFPMGKRTVKRAGAKVMSRQIVWVQLPMHPGSTPPFAWPEA